MHAAYYGVGRGIGFALLGDSLFSIAKKVKRLPLHPAPASPGFLHSGDAQPPERGVRRRL
ncbi:conserved hypothetical protein [Pseudomonas sp. 9Ag]|nr:conserved hypothetical protein [Pseudomonas sp. 9Ag]